MVDQLRRDHPVAANSIAETVRRLGELVPGYWQQPLSLAAKVDLIVHQQGGVIPASEIPKMAQSLGWDVSEDDVTRQTQILVGLAVAVTTS